jgi:hypothetical protein
MLTVRNHRIIEMNIIDIRKVESIVFMRKILVEIDIE